MNATVKDFEEIKAALMTYLKGCNTKGDDARPAFLETATINGAPIETLFKGIDEAGPTNAIGRIDILDVVNDIAVARITMEGWHGDNFVDFHSLIKTKDGWKIAAKVFTAI